MAEPIPENTGDTTTPHFRQAEARYPPLPDIRPGTGGWGRIHTPDLSDREVSSSPASCAAPTAIPPQRKQLIKMAEPVRYFGDSLTKFRVFERTLERQFRANNFMYPTDDIKILYASSYLGGIAERLWSNKEKELFAKDKQPTWEDFKEFLRDQVDDTHNCHKFVVALRFHSLMQQPNQSVKVFQVEAEELMDKVMPKRTPEINELRIQFFFAKLLPHLRHAILQTHEKPQTLSELVSLANSFEQLHELQRKKRPSGTTQKSKKPQESNKKRKRNYDEMSGTGQPKHQSSLSKKKKKKWRDQNLCYLCSGSGHYAKDCKSGKSGKKG